MKKILFIVAIFAMLTSVAQIKISQLPSYTGSPVGGIVPIVIGGVTKGIDGGKLGATVSNAFVADSTDTSKVPSVNAVKNYVQANNGGLPYKILSGWISSSDSTTFVFTKAQDDFNSTYTISKAGVGAIQLFSTVSIFPNISKVGCSGGGKLLIMNGFNYFTVSILPNPSDAQNFYFLTFDKNNNPYTPIFNQRYFFEIRVYQ